MIAGYGGYPRHYRDSAGRDNFDAETAGGAVEICCLVPI